MFSTEHYIPRGVQNHGTTQVCSVSGFPAAIADRNLKETALLIIETGLTQTWGPPNTNAFSVYHHIIIFPINWQVGGYLLQFQTDQSTWYYLPDSSRISHIIPMIILIIYIYIKVKRQVWGYPLSSISSWYPICFAWYSALMWVKPNYS